MLGVVAPDAEDILRGPRYRREQLDGLQRVGDLGRRALRERGDPLQRARSRSDQREHLVERGIRAAWLWCASYPGGARQIDDSPLAHGAQVCPLRVAEC